MIKHNRKRMPASPVCNRNPVRLKLQEQELWLEVLFQAIEDKVKVARIENILPTSTPKVKRRVDVSFNARRKTSTWISLECKAFVSCCVHFLDLNPEWVVAEVDNLVRQNLGYPRYRAAPLTAFKRILRQQVYEADPVKLNAKLQTLLSPVRI